MFVLNDNIVIVIQIFCKCFKLQIHLFIYDASFLLENPYNKINESVAMTYQIYILYKSFHKLSKRIQ